MAQRVAGVTPRLLIVDDDAAIRRMLIRTLRTERNFEIVEVGSGEEAKRALLDTPFDVVITDLNMPKGLSGLGLMAWAQGECPGPVWIILSGYASFDTAVKAIQLGAFDFIAKPVTSQASLRLTVRNALEKRRWEQECDRLSAELRQTNLQLQQQVEQLEAACRLLGNQAEMIGDDLHRAERIQHALLPHTAPDVAGLSVSALYRPSQGVGGDLYDLLRLDDTQIAFAIADAAGHGVSAAMLAVLFKIRLQQLTEHVPPMRPDEVLCAMNEFLTEECGSSGLFVTAAYGIIDTERGEIRFASAGHPPLLVQHADGKGEMLYHTGPALGLSLDSSYAESRVPFATGDRLLCYTDGLYDGWPNEPSPPSERLLAALQESSSEGTELVDGLIDEASLHRAGAPSSDDVTLLLITASNAESHLDNDLPDPARPLRNEWTNGIPSILVGSDANGTALCVEGRGDWTHCTALYKRAENEIGEGHPLVIDLSCCTYLDSTFLGTLHEIISRADAENTPVTIQGLIPQLREHFGELGMKQVLTHVAPVMHALPKQMKPLEQSREASSANRERLLRAHEALSSLSSENRHQFLQLISSIQNGTQH